MQGNDEDGQISGADDKNKMKYLSLDKLLKISLKQLQSQRQLLLICKSSVYLDIGGIPAVFIKM